MNATAGRVSPPELLLLELEDAGEAYDELEEDDELSYEDPPPPSQATMVMARSK